MTQQLDSVVRQVGTVILGKQRQIRLAIACMLARGHLLIEDIPGVGKTTLAHALAGSLGLVSIPAHPVHQRPAAGRYPRRVDLRPRSERVSLSSRARFSRR